MPKVLFSWIGSRDISLARQDKLGALASTLVEPKLKLTEAVLLRNVEEGNELFSPESIATFCSWLAGKVGFEPRLEHVPLDHPMHFRQIYEGVKKVLDQALTPEVSPTFNLSSGTPAMAAVWILIGRGPRPARLTNSSVEAGVVEADVPFDVFTDYLTDVLRASDRALTELSAGTATGAFSDVVFRSTVMADLVERAQRVAEREVPVLLLGESGTGKELFARGIHQASSRAGGPFQVVNCGAIPKDLVESTLFGHLKGSFTGADRDRVGVIRAAHQGTLFLDEIGELPLAAQAKLLRVLQANEVQPVGATEVEKVDVRVVAATHRDVARMAAAGDFRDDLYYRLAVAVLRIPPLRDRAGDLNLLIDDILERVNTEESRRQPGYEARKLTPPARKKLADHDWPGNVRELQNTLVRATVWSSGPRIEPSDIELLPVPARGESVLDHPLGDGFDVNKLLERVRRHYLLRALRQAGGRKTEAAKLLGIGRQSVSDWMRNIQVSGTDAE